MSETLSPAVARPDHITDAVFYDFDMFADPAYLANPHARILDMHKSAPPIFWTPRNGGHWMFVSHAANFEASRDVEKFSSEIVPQSKIKEMMSKLPPGAPHIPQPLPINIDLRSTPPTARRCSAPSRPRQSTSSRAASASWRSA